MRFFYIIIFLLSSLAVFSQNSLSDEEFKELQSKARMQINGSLDSSFYYSNKIEKSSNILHRAFSKGIKSYLFQLEGDTIESNLNYNKALIDLNNLKNSTERTRTKVFIYLYKGLTNWKRKKYSEAIKNYEIAIFLSKSINDKLQVINLSNNMALVYSDIGNFQSAINITKKSDFEIEKLKVTIPLDDYKVKKSNVFLNLGNFYEKMYLVNTITNIKYLDSALNSYNKSIIYSEKLINNKLTAQSNLANLYYLGRKYKEAEKLFYSIYKITHNYDNKYSHFNASYNLGKFYYEVKKYNNALIYFKKVDSLKAKNSFDNDEFMYSKYYQSRIHDSLNNYDKAIENANLYTEEYEKKHQNKEIELREINFYLGNKDTNREIEIIKEKNRLKKTKKYIIQIIIFSLFVILVYFLLKNKRAKKAADVKIQELIKEFKNSELKFQDKNLNSGLYINDKKENEILNKIKDLEIKNYFLSQDFNQQNVAKKIKTNTTYLSHVVNKNFGKTFSEYSNELKINWVIKELINNQTYRKYSTQAIAESAGFKSANSFTKSFKKRTGVTPVQFISKV